MATLGGEEESVTPTKLTFSKEDEDDNNSVLTTISAATNMLPVKTKDEEDINPRVQGYLYHKQGICIAPPNLQLLKHQGDRCDKLHHHLCQTTHERKQNINVKMVKLCYDCLLIGSDGAF
eukprot:4873954-Ditylum_brightwellii.AAC.2